MGYVLKELDLQDATALEDFLRLPERARSSEYQVGLPSLEQMRLLLHWGHANGSTFWLVRAGNGSPVIRFSTRASVQLSDHGTIGCVEILPGHESALAQILPELEDWFRKRGLVQIVAPVDFNTWFNYRFSVPSKNFYPRFSWEPTTPPSYLEAFQQLGFTNWIDYQSIIFPLIKVLGHTIGTGQFKKKFQRLAETGFSLRPFNMSRFMEDEIPLFHNISHEVFPEAPLFEPIDLETFRHLYAAAKQVYDFTPSSVLVTPEGESVGFLFAFFDGKYSVIKSLAIRKKYQGLKLSSAMVWYALRSAIEHNKKAMVSALMKTGLSSETMSLNAKKGVWFTTRHDYVLLKKALP